MVYEFRKYNSSEDFENERDLGVTAWETDEIMDDANIRFCGKLIAYVWGDREKKRIIPDGFEALGKDFLAPEYWGWRNFAGKVYIPASVKFIDEDAFGCNILELTIVAPKGSYAIEWAKEHDYNFEEK
jgi:hypothetical protein